MGKRYRTITEKEEDRKITLSSFRSFYRYNSKDKIQTFFNYNQPFDNKDNNTIEIFTKNENISLGNIVYPREYIVEIEEKKEIVNKIRTYV